MGLSKATSSSNVMQISNIEKKISCLIVDDSPLIQKIHKAMMTKFGIEATIVTNGQEAIDLHNSGAAFDLILMDLEMPVMDGLEATKKLRAMGITSMLVGVTSRNEEPMVRAFMESGLNAYYEKPLNVEKITDILNVLKKN